jgi:hypothetical protein
MNRTVNSKYLNLRLIVGYLGERLQYGWWSTAFFDAASIRVLSPVFPKTFRLAQYNGVREAARLLHDEYIGIGNVFHLFRLPEEMEQDLHALMHEKQTDMELLTKLQNRDDALQALVGIADGNRDLSEGPIKIGELKNIHTANAVKSIAQSYLAAFQQSKRTYPYFVGQA